MHDVDFTAQLEQHHVAAFCWALSCCGRDATEAEDVLQSVYVKILEGRARFRGESSFRTWLFSLVRNTAADRRRRRLLGRILTLRIANRDGAAESYEHPDDVVTRAETREAFVRALGVLSTRQREALELVFYHDLSIEEAAAVMKVGVGSARQHYERGKRRLREVLEESEVEYVSEWRARAHAREIS